MRFAGILFLCFLFCIAAFVGVEAYNSVSEGVTGTFSVSGQQDGTELAEARPAGTPYRLIQFDEIQPSVPCSNELDDWQPYYIVEACQSIAAGQHLAYSFTTGTETIEEIIPEESFSDLCWEAIDRAPNWLRLDLIDNLRQFETMGFLQDMIAEVILNTEDPYVDEIAFTMAHLNPGLLISGRIDWNFDIFVENVEGVYEADEYFDYVQINDYGTSEDDDYYSTTEYEMRDADGNPYTVEIDKEYYYWYIVHPRITDEIPRYINPETGSGAAPPTGRFWREYVLTSADSGYTSLQDYLSECEFMYGNLNHGTDDNGAVGRLLQWIGSVLTFDSGSERPIQPVRILAIHMGRCGEHQDLRVAAGRSALIPMLGTCSLTEDHVWNEFWSGERWIHYDGNDVDLPLVYESGWGKRFPALFNWRSDGWIWTVTDRYCAETSLLTVQVLDSEDQPVDGVKVKMLSSYLYGGLRFATCGYTNSEGIVEFDIGPEKPIYINVSGELGSYPGDPDNGVLVIEESEVGLEYEWVYNYDDAIGVYFPSDAEPPQEPDNTCKFQVDYDLLAETTYDRIFTDADFVAEVGQGQLDMFVCDAENYTLFEAGEEFEAFNFQSVTGSGIYEFVLPEEGEWLFVVSNTNNIANYQHFQADVGVYINEEEDVQPGDDVVPTEFALQQNFPNPFNGSTELSFTLAHHGQTSIAIYNVMGQLVRTERLGSLQAGTHSISLNMDELPSGVYLYELRSGEYSAVNRMLLLK